MEVRPGYKLTDVGVLPDDWTVTTLESVVRSDGLVRGPFGGALKKEIFVDRGYKVYEQGNAIYGSLERGRYFIDPHKFQELIRFRVDPGDFIVSCSGTIGSIFQIPVGAPEGVINQALLKISVDQAKIDLRFFLAVFRSAQFQERIRDNSHGGAMQNLVGMDIFKKTQLQLPPTMDEQGAIAEALSDADALIESLEQFLAKKRHLKQGAMQELLTGKRRLPGFSGEWKVKQIAEIAYPSSERNSSGNRLTVLTCSKHLGFIDSLSYFKSQVFSRDLSGYKLIKRGQIGYPANHVEEGSIGLQDLYDLALVSPIYVVFSVVNEVNSYFLHRLLKLDSYRQKFATETSSSIDRRGSLRWNQFSQITVSLPSVDEQEAIAAVLSDMDAEIDELEQKVAKARQIKQGMMQELLTGRIRLV